LPALLSPVYIPSLCQEIPVHKSRLEFSRPPVEAVYLQQSVSQEVGFSHPPSECIYAAPAEPGSGCPSVAQPSRMYGRLVTSHIPEPSPCPRPEPRFYAVLQSIVSGFLR